MSVYAFVQSPKNDGFDFMVKNGVLIEDLDEAYKKVEADNIPTMEELIQKCQNALDGDENER